LQLAAIEERVAKLEKALLELEKSRQAAELGRCSTGVAHVRERTGGSHAEE
jgi:hypothetical protein